MAKWLISLVAALWLAALGRDAFDRWIEATKLPPVVSELSTEFHDRNGALLRVYTVENGRWRLPPGAVDPQFVEMLLRIEDKRFYTHPGVDPRAMIRAAWQSLRRGKVVSGGSTITMQLARLLENGPTGQIKGKLRQIRVAYALERNLPKDKILELYLTHAPYGGNLEGVRAASLAWFGKEPRRLTPAQSALLIALPQAPETRRPDRFAEEAERARNGVLDRLAHYDLLTVSGGDAAKLEPIPAFARPFPSHAPHLTDRLASNKPDQRAFRTTLDLPLQSALENLAKSAVFAEGEAMSIAIVVADHQTGDILASVGSADFSAGPHLGYVDMTRAVRSPGSTLKPLIYGLAFDAGLAHPETLLEDRPTAFGTYMPQNFDGQFRGTLRAREALQLSLNIPAVSLTVAIGPANLMGAMRRSGATPTLPGDGAPGLAVALGGVGVTLEDMVQLYGGIANRGNAIRLRSETVSNAPEMQQIIAREAAWHISDILSDIPPPEGAAQHGIAYKTGTSYGHRDTWAIGFDGAHVIGVWMGRPDGTPIPGQFGGALAAPVLFDAFAKLKPSPVPLPPPPPSTLIASTTALPLPLQRFQPRHLNFVDQTAPKLVFPPANARLQMADIGLPVKIRGGQAPFTLIANGAPVANISARENTVAGLGRGFTTLTVIDALGRADRVEIWLD